MRNLSPALGALLISAREYSWKDCIHFRDGERSVKVVSKNYDDLNLCLDTIDEGDNALSLYHLAVMPRHLQNERRLQSKAKIPHSGNMPRD